MAGYKEAYMTPIGERLIRELIERKQEEKKRERLVTVAGWITTAMFALLLVLLFSMVESNVGASIMQFFLSAYGFVLVAICAGASAFLIIEKKKSDKAEEEYTELRNEVVERYEEIWNTEQLREYSYALFEWLEREHDVNLYHR
ncbi:DUF2663 family protein [Salicibibacter cibarius]|uniref:DUF2663 family protein n=1 Tax=Salicibibacter cibarius TaxID=2743000 RepID=A0A7T6Z2X1_9BACI|nr:DUF2663 family protein [Salicibibacter cibarius]QQK75984.1 DUF2663 family protein [Salicibibacter cibarius]